MLDLINEVSVMLDLINGYRAELLAVMIVAFERATQVLLSPDTENARRTLALEILRRVDEGERDPMRLSELALKRIAAQPTTTADLMCPS